MTLTEFLLTRIAEDEAEAERSEPMRLGVWGEFTIGERVLAECAAKRQIVRDYQELAADEPADPYRWDDVTWASLTTTKRAVAILAAVHADHPDYREEWKP